MGPMKHTGSGGYLDARSFLANSTSFVDHTVAVVEKIVEESVEKSVDQSLVAPTNSMP
jgi:hypothetical protein